MEHITRVVGPVATNVHILADPASREAMAIDTAIPSLAWIVDELAARDWTLKLIVSTHGHWDHIGDNAALAELNTKARIPASFPDGTSNTIVIGETLKGDGGTKAKDVRRQLCPAEEERPQGAQG